MEVVKQNGRPIRLIGRLEPVDDPTLSISQAPPLVMEILVITAPGTKSSSLALPVLEASLQIEPWCRAACTVA